MTCGSINGAFVFVILDHHGSFLPSISAFRDAHMTDPPSNIRAIQIEQVLEVTWPDAQVDRFPYVFLRSECPCATCRDEWTGERILRAESIRSDLRLEGMEPIGTYAVQLAWSDGHSSGLFSWETLRQLAGQIPA